MFGFWRPDENELPVVDGSPVADHLADVRYGKFPAAIFFSIGQNGDKDAGPVSDASADRLDHCTDRIIERSAVGRSVQVACQRFCLGDGYSVVDQPDGGIKERKTEYGGTVCCIFQVALFLKQVVEPATASLTRLFMEPD